MSESPQVDLSTSSAFLWQGSTEPPVDVEQWQPVRVILAHITKETYGLVICPVLECGLAVHPVVPAIEMLIPDSATILKFDEGAKGVSVKRIEQGTSPTTTTVFRLRFDDMLEFWDFASTAARLRSDEEIRKADLMYKLNLVRLFVPSHGPSGLMDGFCADVDHASASGDLSPRSSSSSSSSSTITLTGV